MLSVDRRFTDLDSIVDDIHDLFAWWSVEAQEAGALDETSIHVLRLAVHEWLANLVQHANFPEGNPLIKLSLAPDGKRIRCSIEDNSMGFDFVRQIAQQQVHLEVAPEPPDRGRGLLMMIACTENLSYQPVTTSSGDGASGAASQLLEFWVSNRDNVGTPAPESEAEVHDEPPSLPSQFSIECVAVDIASADAPKSA